MLREFWSCIRSPKGAHAAASVPSVLFVMINCASAAPMPVAPAQFSVIAGEFCCSLFPTLVPGTSAMLDLSSTLGHVLVRADADPFGPNASIDAELSQVAGDLPPVAVSAGARVEYFFRVSPAGSGLVQMVTRVPITVMGNAEASANGSSTPFGAVAFAQLSSPVGTLFAEACSGGIVNERQIGLCGTQAPANAISGFVAPGDDQAMTLLVGGYAGSLDAGFTAAADPIISIDDALIPGTNINFRDAFTIDLSPGIVQSFGGGGTNISEPFTLALVGIGLAALGGVARKGPRL